jgi:hypothetical protein
MLALLLLVCTVISLLVCKTLVVELRTSDESFLQVQIRRLPKPVIAMV